LPASEHGYALLDLILIGSSRDVFLPYFVYAIGEMGLPKKGTKRPAYKLSRIVSLDYGRREVLVHDGRFFKGEPQAIQMADIERGVNGDRGIAALTMHVQSPLRLKIQDGDEKSRLVSRPSFQDLIDRLAFRADLLHVYHCGGQTDYDHRALVAAAGEVRMVDPSPIYWQERSRYSRSQDARMNLDGFMGEARFEGPNLERFLPLLKLGEYIHVGKNTTFGHGAIRVEVER